LGFVGVDKMSKEFVCLDCWWSQVISNKRVYCTKKDAECQGYQSHPVHICEDRQPIEELTDELNL
jgi:hypothetical protein